jgi:hypothetical protein
MEHEYDDAMIEDAAEQAHEANRAYCILNGDLSQPRWGDASEWARTSAINGVKFVIDNWEATPRDLHNNWLQEKTADGWRWGPVKDPNIKEHPCFCAFEELPKEQQTKDYIFGAVVRGFLTSRYS